MSDVTMTVATKRGPGRPDEAPSSVSEQRPAPNKGGRPRGSKKKPEPINDLRLINRRDLAALLGCSIKTLRRMEKDKGWPKAFPMGDGRPTLFYLRAEIEAYIASRHAAAQSEREPPPNIARPERKP